MSQHPFSKLKPEDILDAVEALGFDCDGRLNALNSYENRVFQIGIHDSAPIIAKFYRPNRWTKEQIQDEHEFSFELAVNEWPIVAPLKAENGESLHCHAGFYFSLFDRQGGYAPELDQLDTLIVMGRALGRLHAIGSQSSFSYRPSLDIQTYGVESREFLLTEGFLPDSLRAAYESLSLDLLNTIKQQFDEIRFETIRLHADCHPGNILWRDDRAYFVDFDDCCLGPAVQDIWMLLSGDYQERQLQLETILEGYELFNEFDDRELDLIEGLRTLRIMNYAAWLARRWDDPAFPQAFPWFNTERYWGEHILELREQMASLQEPSLKRLTGNS